MMTATYSPEDNKLRLYTATRLDRDLYDRVKAAGFRWAPKQDLFVAPMWTPEREDLLIELCEEVGDEDTALVDRAEARAERFGEYREHRAADAEQAYKSVQDVAQRFEGGQPILVGHHSEKKARRDKERMDAGMQKAVQMWDTAEYWKSRARGAIMHAKYKERPDVRARRIKGIEADMRREIASYTPDPKTRPILQRGWNDAPEAEPVPHVWCGQARGGHWVPQHSLQAIEARAQRWIRHYENRLAYERAMLDEGGGLKAAAWDIQPGGRVRADFDKWYVVVKCNRKGGELQSVSVIGHWSTVKVEDIRDYQAPAEGDAEKIAKITTQAPLCNWRAPNCVEMTTEQWKQHQRASDFHYVANWTPEHTSVWGKNAQGVLYRQRSLGRMSGERRPVFLTDAAEKAPPAPGAPAPAPTFAPPAISERPEPMPAAAAEPSQGEKFKALRDTLRNGGVQTIVAPQLFPTPPELAARMVQYAAIREGDAVLEPSAGTGNLIRAIKETGVYGVAVCAIEINGRLCDALRSAFPVTNGDTWNGSAVTVMQADFLDMPALNQKFDVILMNPPFQNAEDICHILRARAMLAPGGTLVAICANGSRQADALQDEADTWEELPAGTFDGTQVRTVLLTMRKGVDTGGQVTEDIEARPTTAEGSKMAELLNVAEDTGNGLRGQADVEYRARLDAERVTLEFSTHSTKRLDTGKVPMDESPLFGGKRQQSLFDTEVA